MIVTCCLVVGLIGVALSFAVNHYLATCVFPLNSCSDRLCGVRLCDSSGLSYLLVCVYMPTCYRPDSYLNTLGEL